MKTKTKTKTNHTNGAQGCAEGPALVGPREIATLLGIGYRLALLWTEDGRLPVAVREGRVLRYDPDECRRALRKRAAQPWRAKRAAQKRELERIEE